MTDNPMLSFSLNSAADLSAARYRFVAVDATGRVVVAGDGVTVIGVLQNKPSAADRACNVCFAGVCKVVSGGVVTAGDPVASDLNGAGIKALAGKGGGGVALASAVAGDIFPVLLMLGPGQLL